MPNFAILWTVAHQAPLSRQECWSGLPCPRPGDLPNPGMEQSSFMSSALAGSFFTTSTAREALKSSELAKQILSSILRSVYFFHSKYYNRQKKLINIPIVFFINNYTEIAKINWASLVAQSACNARDLGSIPGLVRSPGGGGHGNPLQYSCLKNPHGQRSLTGYSPWGCKESDTTERLSHSTHRAKSSASSFLFGSSYPDLKGKKKKQNTLFLGTKISPIPNQQFCV